MLKRRLAGRLRRVSIWLLVAVVALVGVFTIQQAASIEEEAARRERARTMQELSNLVALWEGLITDRIRSWTTDLGDAASAQREQQLRQTVAWFDAYYRWNITGDVQWPLRTPTTDITALLDAPCLSSANGLRVTGQALDAAAAFQACPPASQTHGLVASYLAARIRLDAGATDLALRGLERAVPPLRMSLVHAAGRDLDVGLLIQRREQALQALDALGRTDAHRKLAADTIRAITDLSSPDLQVHLEGAEHILDALPEDTPELGALTNRVERARRRVVAYRELEARLISESRSATPGELHIVQDLYSKPGFLLVWTAIDDRQRAAIQVDASDLLRSLSETLPPTTGVYIVDSRGRPLGPDGRQQADVTPIAVSASVGLGRLFPHLHIAEAQSSSSGKVALDRILLPLAPLGVSLILGLLAVWAQVTAGRREQDLQHRQQEFITRVTHELKTPLAGIRVMAETLQLGAAQDPKTRDQFLDRILSECNNLSARIDEVLNAARKPQIRNVVKISADELVKSVVDRWDPRFAQRDALLETRLDGTPPVSVDIDLMHDAIGNLLDNALKYRRPGIRGICRVRTGTTGRWVIIEVADNGMGIPPEKRHAVFERFTRVEGPGRGKAGGHGLGLAFVADTAEAHDGLVECVDGIDGGACFRIKLPRR